MNDSHSGGLNRDPVDTDEQAVTDPEPTGPDGVELTVHRTGRDSCPTVSEFELTFRLPGAYASPSEPTFSVAYSMVGSTAQIDSTSVSDVPENAPPPIEKHLARLALADTYAVTLPFVQAVSGPRNEIIHLDPATNPFVIIGPRQVETPDSVPEEAHTQILRALHRDTSAEERRRAMQQALAHLGSGNIRTAVAYIHVWAAARVDQQEPVFRECLSVAEDALAAISVYSGGQTNV